MYGGRASSRVRHRRSGLSSSHQLTVAAARVRAIEPRAANHGRGRSPIEVTMG